MYEYVYMYVCMYVRLRTVDLQNEGSHESRSGGFAPRLIDTLMARDLIILKFV
jgi:hypothetical protein